jgi:tRNA (pseudouridine54-N1)-methyltransferase
MKHLTPDERTTATLFEKALGAFTTGPVWQASTPGVDVAVLGFEEALGDGPLVQLHEEGEDVAAADLPPDATFVLGDHLGFTPEEEDVLRRRGARRVSLGPVSLQADQCIVVLHNHLDRR